MGIEWREPKKQPKPGRVNPPPSHKKGEWTCNQAVTFALSLTLIIVGVLVAAGVANAATPLRVMPLGDSITLGVGDGTATGLQDGYRCALKAKLRAAGQEIDYVGSQTSGPPQCPDGDIQHEGHSGWTTTQLLGQTATWVAAAQPDVVLLMIGTNDIKLRQWDGLTARLGQIIDLIHDTRPGTLVVVSTLVQYQTSDQPTIDAWNAYRDAVPVVAAAHGARVAYNDNVTRAELADGIHPKGCAYDGKMAWSWYFAWTQTTAAPNGAGWPQLLPTKVC